MSAELEKFQTLLRELFQFDCADLDFGIYRIMNYKRDAVEEFITKKLPKAVSDELSSGALAEQSRSAKELAEVSEQISKTLGKDAIDADGNLAETYRETPLGKKYLDLKAKAAGGRGHGAVEAAIFNHLYSFFSRYYHEGDFISKRRYSKRQKYAIPYNGEEVHLHWANHDQYYIKTAEHFTSYSFASKGVTVRFEIQAADVEQNNVKGDKRFFIPCCKGIVWDEKASLLVIPFEYRPLTGQEEISYGKKNQQDAVNAKALEDIPKQLKKADDAMRAIMAERGKDSKDNPVTFLGHHLRQYTRANTSDFFIHKDLHGFLSRELDFYLKNEVLSLDEMEAAGEGRAEGWFQVMRVIKAVGGSIIEFLSQIENFQKMLWEKRKFITETQYCITVGNVDKDFYPEIADCESQWAEWKELFHINDEQADLFTAGKNKKEKRAAFLKAHPTLVLDTKHFEQEFSDRLLASFENLDEMTDGLLVHSENFQALCFLREQYRGQIACIHIDPPYNTQTSGFLYKNTYQHSSWLAMMENRISAGMSLLSKFGSYLCHIDENEYERLQLLFDNFSVANAGTIAWDKRNPMNAGRGIATQHEYIVWRSNKESPICMSNKNILSILKAAADIVRKHGGVSEVARKEYAGWINSNEELSGGEKAYRYLDDQGRVYRGVSLRAPEPRTDSKFHEPLLHPITQKPCPVPPNGFSRTPETLKAMEEKGEIIFGQDETVQPQQKRFLTPESTMQISSMIQDGKKGKTDVAKMSLDFPYCHPVSLYRTLIAAACGEPNDIVFDFFAGSGTTAHAVIELNREDMVGRKFFLAEVNNYLDTIILPRIKKVTFSPDWKDGKPTRMATKEEAERSPRIVKYMRLESYEDALNNIQLDDASGQAGLKFDDYLFKYMLHWEARKSETMLNVEKLASPFSYALHVHRDGQTTKRTVDIPETFNYLLGLHVSRRQVFHDKDRRYLVYRGRIDRREIAVIWRETKDWKKADFERDKKFVEEKKLAQGADEVFVNGDSFIVNARALEPVFKARMFSPVEA
ncbi:MAG: site-specific DNA-methyltransferase [Deltaproteobacteria bacterium]|nr:site-specific DNA-methyltransferase [Deltaproteobacteria bacterium]